MYLKFKTPFDLSLMLAVVEVAPIQNQAASQKLLQKMSQENHQNRHYKGNRQRGKYREEEVPVFTLDEWERRKTGSSKPSVRSESSNVSHDEELAWQLQRQLDLEDSHVSFLKSLYHYIPSIFEQFLKVDLDGIFRFTMGSRQRQKRLE